MRIDAQKILDSIKPIFNRNSPIPKYDGLTHWVGAKMASGGEVERISIPCMGSTNIPGLFERRRDSHRKKRKYISVTTTLKNITCPECALPQVAKTIRACYFAAGRSGLNIDQIYETVIKSMEF